MTDFDFRSMMSGVNANAARRRQEEMKRAAEEEAGRIAKIEEQRQALHRKGIRRRLAAVASFIGAAILSVSFFFRDDDKKPALPEGREPTQQVAVTPNPTFKEQYKYVEPNQSSNIKFIQVNNISHVNKVEKVNEDIFGEDTLKDIEQAVEAALPPSTPTVAPTVAPTKKAETKQEGISSKLNDELFFEFVKESEIGREVKTEDCLTWRDERDGKLTVYTGVTVDIDNKEGIKAGDKITKSEAIKLFKKQIGAAYRAVDKLLKSYPEVELKQHQINALASIYYNTGESDPSKLNELMDAYVKGDLQGVWDDIKIYRTFSTKDKEGNKVNEYAPGLKKQRIREFLLFTAKTPEEIKSAYKLGKDEVEKKYLFSGVFYSKEDWKELEKKVWNVNAVIRARNITKESRVDFETAVARIQAEMSAGELERG